MKFRNILFSLLLISLSLTIGVLSQTTNNLPLIKYEDYRLKNGLRVVLHQDRSTPIVAVNVWYHVGSKNEVKGKTGLAHFFEHMMFQGSKNYSANFSIPIQEAGTSISNAVTTQDSTNYFELVPSNFLELALFLEADRMGGLVMTQERFDNQREVIKNEIRGNFNQPYGTEIHNIFAEMYPNHPYQWHPGGSTEDLMAASLDDANAFYRRYYAPNNAILSVAGDFDKTQTMVWIEKYFGPIAKGADIARPNPPQPKLNGELRKTVEDSVSLPRLSMVWHSVPRYSPDDAALDVLTYILSRGRGARLANNLVYDKEIAQFSVAISNTSEIAGYFWILSLAKPGKSLEEVEKEVNVEIERIKKEPPTVEKINRALNQIESEKMFNLQTVLVKGDLLGEYAMYLNKPDFFQSNLNRYRKVTAQDIQRVAQKYLTANRLVLSYVPRKGDAPKTAPAAADNSPASIKPRK